MQMSETILQQAAREYNVYFRYDSPKPYQIVTSGNDVYMRWSTDDTNPIFIMRTNTNGGTVTNTYTIDVWSNRATATYFYDFS